MKTIINRAAQIVKEHKTEAAVVAIIGIATIGLIYGHKANLIYASEGDRILRIIEKVLINPTITH